MSGFALTPFDPVSGVSPLRLVCCPPVLAPFQYLHLFFLWHGASRCCSGLIFLHLFFSLRSCVLAAFKLRPGGSAGPVSPTGVDLHQPNQTRPNQTNSSPRAAVTMRLATSSCNPLARSPAPSLVSLLRSAMPTNAFCHSQLRTRIAGALHQIDRHSRSADNGDNFRVAPNVPVFRRQIELATLWCKICGPHLPKVLRACQF